jgi:lambda family phage portal protein
VAGSAALPAAGKRTFVFEGSAGNRLTLDWVAPILSPDQEARGNLRLLRARGRELVRNNPTAKHFLNLLATNVIGDRGIRYRGRVRNNDGQLNRAFNSKIEDAWAQWGKKDTCSCDGKLSLRAVQDLVLRTVAMDGEAFVRLVRGWPNPYGLALQLIDADQVDHLYSRAPGKGVNEIRLGVEVDSWGKPVAYWINPGHPSDYGGSLLRERVPAGQIIHVYDPMRVQQTRGLTWFHPVMMALKMMHGYTEAELVAARVSAAKPGWFQYKDATTYDAPDPTTPLRMEANPGMYEKLPPGLEFVSNNSDHPANAFAQYIQANLRLIASGLGASYNSLANDLVGVNYSSLRSGLLIERDHWTIVQQWFSEAFMQPLFDAWLDMALLAGGLVLDSRDPARFRACVWMPRGWRWVDPLKDSQGAIIDIAAAINSPERVVAERGDDLEEIYEEIAEAQKLAKAYGIQMNLQPPNRPGTQNNPAEVEDQETEEGEKEAAAAGAGSK